MSFDIEINNNCECDECSSYFSNNDRIYCEACYDSLLGKIEELENEIKELKNENNN